jgi:hypothetical protein
MARRTGAAQQRRDALGAEVEDRLEVASHEQPVGQLAGAPEAQRVAHGVAHQRGRPAVERLELVRVVPQPVRAAHLHVDEAVRRLPGLDDGVPADGQAAQP